MARCMATLVVVGLAAAASAAISGFVLTKIYVPPLEGLGAASHAAQVARSAHWGHWHRRAIGVFLVASVCGFGVGVVRMWRSVGRWRGLALAGSAVAASVAVVTLVTESIVEWDQLALYAITDKVPGSGYWTAAFSQNVRFILSNNTQVSQNWYQIVLVVHLAAPVVGIVALVGVGIALLKSKLVETDASDAVELEGFRVFEKDHTDRLSRRVEIHKE